MRYIIGICNVSSQGEWCMIILMVDLVILVIFISDKSIWCEENRHRRYKFRGRWRNVKFSTFHFPYAGSMNQSRVYTWVPSDTDAYAFMIRKINMTTEDQEYQFRGSISLTTDDCIIGTISSCFSVLNNDGMIHGFLCWRLWMLGCTFLGGALVLLSIINCWHYDGSEIWSLSWGLSSIGHVKSYMYLDEQVLLRPMM